MLSQSRRALFSLAAFVLPCEFLVESKPLHKICSGDPKQPKSRVATERFLEVVSEIPLWILHENEANSWNIFYFRLL